MPRTDPNRLIKTHGKVGIPCLVPMAPWRRLLCVGGGRAWHTAGGVARLSDATPWVAQGPRLHARVVGEATGASGEPAGEATSVSGQRVRAHGQPARGGAFTSCRTRQRCWHSGAASGAQHGEPTRYAAACKRLQHGMAGRCGFQPAVVCTCRSMHRLLLHDVHSHMLPSYDIPKKTNEPIHAINQIDIGLLKEVS